MQYKLIFKGETGQGVSTEHGRLVLGKMFKLDLSKPDHLQKLDRLFSGKPVVLKKGISDDNARALKLKLENAGLVCYIKQENADSGDTSKQAIQSTAQPTPSLAQAANELSLVPVEDSNKNSDEAQSDNDANGGLGLVAMEEKASATESLETVSQPGVVEEEPQGTYSKYNTRFTDDTSGGGSGSYVPDEVSGWCWGGFFWGWIWSIFNRTWIGLLGLIPVVNIAVAVLLGLKGREWAWQNRRWNDIEHFNRVQRYWSLSGLVFVVGMFWYYWTSLPDMADMQGLDAMMDEQGVLKDDYIDSIEDEKQREMLKLFQQQLREELEKQRALQN